MWAGPTKAELGCGGGAYAKAEVELAGRSKGRSSLRSGIWIGGGAQAERGRGAEPSAVTGQFRASEPGKAPRPQVSPWLGGCSENFRARLAYFRLRWRRPPQSGATDCVFRRRCDSRPGEGEAQGSEVRPALAPLFGEVGGDLLLRRPKGGLVAMEVGRRGC